jgi:hypothetical protein
MRDLKLSLKEVATKVGTSYEHVRNILRGNVSHPTRWQKRWPKL